VSAYKRPNDYRSHSEFNNSAKTNHSRHLINKVRVSLSWQLDQKFRKAQEHEEHIETLTFPEAKLNQIEAISSPFSVIQR